MKGGGWGQTKEHCCCLTGVLREGRGADGGESVTEEVLSLRIEIKMNGWGAGVSVLFTVIKRTSSASHFFPHTNAQFALSVGAIVKNRGEMGGLFHCFVAIVQYLLNPHALSVQLYNTNEMGEKCVFVCVCALAAVTAVSNFISVL